MTLPGGLEKQPAYPLETSSRSVGKRRRALRLAQHLQCTALVMAAPQSIRYLEAR
jgi:hypothetical protein